MAVSQLNSTVKLLSYLLLCTFVSADNYYISESPSNTICSYKNVTCFSLTNYAQQILENKITSSDITLIFAPGHHHLGSNLQLMNVNSLTIQVSEPNNPLPVVTCNRSGFVFENMSRVSIAGIEFSGCINSTVKSVDQFRLEGCRFHTGHGIELEKVKKANIERSSFVLLKGREVEPGVRIGGAIVSKLSAVVINGCQFDWNIAEYGGSIYSNNGDIEINMSTFTNNAARQSDVFYGYRAKLVTTFNPLTGQWITQIINKRVKVNSTVIKNGGNIGGYGGAIYSRDRCSIKIKMSNFTNSTADKHGGAAYLKIDKVTIETSKFNNNTAWKGGALSANDFTKIDIQESMFAKNQAEYGGVIHVVNGKNISILESAFINNTAYMSGGVFHARACLRMYLKESAFFNNRAKYNGGVINWAGESIIVQDNEFTYNRAEKDGGVIYARDGYWCTNITIKNSDFLYNTANEDGGAIYAACDLTFSNLGVLPYYHTIITLDVSKFNNNAATSGGAIYSLSASIISYDKLRITHNTAQTGVIFAIGSKLLLNNSIISNNHGSLCAFSSNITIEGSTTISNNVINGSGIQDEGTLTFVQSDIRLTGWVNIFNNQVYNRSGGAILSAESRIHTSGSIKIFNNTAWSGGGIYIYQGELNFKGVTTISKNTAVKKGGGIYAVGTIIKLSKGELHFSENKAEEGGGVCLELNAKLYVIRTRCKSPYSSGSFLCILSAKSINLGLAQWGGTTKSGLHFTNNTANYGGALYISDNTNFHICSADTSEQTTSSECFFQIIKFYQHYDYSDSLDVKKLYFTSNTATKSGGTIYGGLLDRCKINPYTKTFSKYQNLSSTSLDALSYLYEVSDLTANDIQNEISSEPVRLCFCVNGQQDCNYSPPLYQVRKGHTFQLTLVAVDQVNNSVPSVIKAFLSSHDGGLGEGQDIQSTTSNCTELTYTVSSPHNSEQLVLYAEGPCIDNGISQTQITVKFLPCNCPVGFNVRIQQSNCICDCDPQIYPKYITRCFLENESIERRDNKWINYINTPDQEGYLIHPHCPFDYCRPATEQVWINLNVPAGSDAQCAFNRSGKLCGTCKDGFSLSLGSSHCLQCSNNWLPLLIVFALAGIALVAFILVCNLTVAVGTINGLIFYANVLYTDRATFFPFETHNFFTVFIAWLNLDFGFVTCFFDGMDGYSKTWLQLAFPLYVIFMVTTVITACEYSTSIARIFTKTNPVATLATLILLSYTKSVRVIIAALSSTTLNYPDGSYEIVWLTDANINYFEGKHIPLFLAGLSILMVGIVYTLFLFLYQWLLRCSYNRALEWIRSARFFPFMDAYHAPYTKKHRYWTGLLLFVRAFLCVIPTINVSGDPSINLLLISCTMVALCLLKMLLYSKVYKTWPLDVIEMLVIINLVIFSIASLYIRDAGGNQAALAYTSTSIAFITFLIILLYHTYAFVLPKKLRCILDSLKPKVPANEGTDDDYNINPISENKCTHSVVDAIPPLHKTLAEVEALYKQQTNILEEEKCDKIEPKCPSVKASDRNGTVSKDEQHSIVNRVDSESKSPTLSNVKVFVDPYIANVDQRGLERETELNEF